MRNKSAFRLPLSLILLNLNLNLNLILKKETYG